MRVLFLKELRSLLPLYLILAVLFSADVVSEPFIKRLDELNWRAIAVDIAPGGEPFFGVLFGILAFMVAYSAYPREHDERTIEFLSSLPIRPTTVFAIKVSAGLTVLWAAMLGGAFTNWLLQLSNTQSFSGDQWNTATAAPVIFLRGAVLTAFYGHGMLASFFRRFGLLPVFLVAMGVVWLTRMNPAYHVADPNELLAHQFDGRGIDVPWEGVFLHLGLGTLSLLLGGVLWLGLGDRASSALGRANESAVGRLSLGCGTSVIVIMALTLLVILVEAEGPAPIDTVHATNPAPSTPKTSPVVRDDSASCCAVSYRRHDEARALRLIARSDEMVEKVRAILGDSGAGKERLTVDLTEASDGHLGVASYDRMRVGLAADQNDDALANTFAHETAHTVQHNILGSDANNDGITFVIEGGAAWVASVVVPDPERKRHALRLTAALTERHGLDFDDILEEEEFCRRYGSLMGYPVGESWTAALADGCGEAAPGELLRAIAEDIEVDSPSMWTKFSHRLPCEESARASWHRRDEAVRSSERKWLDALPNLGGHIHQIADNVVTVRAYADRALPEASIPVISFRRHAAAKSSEVRGAQGEVLETPASDRGPVTIEYRIPEAFVRTQRIEVQFGVEVGGQRPAYLQPWQTLAVP